jgi:hypothetical protein
MEDMDEQAPDTLRSQDEINAIRAAEGDLDTLKNYALLRAIIANGPATTHNRTSHILTVEECAT